MGLEVERGIPVWEEESRRRWDWSSPGLPYPISMLGCKVQQRGSLICTGNIAGTNLRSPTAEPETFSGIRGKSPLPLRIPLAVPVVSLYKVLVVFWQHCTQLSCQCCKSFAHNAFYKCTQIGGQQMKSFSPFKSQNLKVRTRSSSPTLCLQQKKVQSVLLAEI